MTMNNEENATAVWARFKAAPRPAFELIKHASTCADPYAELARIVLAIPTDEATALLAGIAAEKECRAAWLAAHGGDAS
jgi:hypothetical protein